MEAAAFLRPIHVGKQHSESFLENPGFAHLSRRKTHLFSRAPAVRLTRKGSFLRFLNASQSTSVLASNGSSVEISLKDYITNLITNLFYSNWSSISVFSAVTSDKISDTPFESQSVQKSTFPSGFEALVSEVCDETSIAELKLKVHFTQTSLELCYRKAFSYELVDVATIAKYLIGNFELHLKRGVGIPNDSPPPTPPIVSPTMAPPIPSEPMNESSPAAQPVVPPKSPAAETSPFANVSSAKASKLAALEASGSNAYVIVSSPTVGTFRRGRTLKGKKQPPSCKEGDLIKEGQTIGFLDQFGNELPIRSDVAGEILKVLYKDGEAVGYGDPLVAVLPSFHGIE